MEKEAKKKPAVIIYKPTTKKAMNGVDMSDMGENVTMIMYPANVRLHQRRMVMHNAARATFSKRGVPKVSYVKEIMHDGHEYDICYCVGEGVSVDIDAMIKAVFGNTASYTFEVIT